MYFYNTGQNSPIHTLRADDFSTKSQPAQHELIHTPMAVPLGFSILPEDTSMYRAEEPGIEPPTL